jgi:hypothetical protein
LHEIFTNSFLRLVFSRLPQASGAAYDSRANEDEPRCHPKTRISLLYDIDYWINNPSGRCIFWLKGMAGTGKSTISRTVAESLARQELLGASFFFKRGEGERGNASRFFTTLAAQLAIKLPEVVTDIITALNADPNLPDTALKTQWEKLVLGPLSTILRTSSSNRKKVVILIDALDECDDEQDLKMILRLLPKSRGLNGVDLRVFVTSRPELPIRLGFQEMNIDAHQNIALHDVPNEIIDHDLHAFLKDEFAQIRSRRLLPPTWPTENEIEALVQIARPLFIHAATICRFVADTRLGDPRDLLNNILKYKAAN